MTSDLDIYRTANVLIREHGDEADLVAAMGAGPLRHRWTALRLRVLSCVQSGGRRPMDRIDSRIVGAAGEHFVIYQLLRRGWIAAKAPEGVPNVDLLITDPRAERLWSVQVKTRFRGHGWLMSEKHEALAEPGLVYVFVALDDPPTCYIIPSRIVADVVRTSHQVWLRSPGRRGQPHKDNSNRNLLADYSRLNPVDDEGRAFVAAHSDGWLDQYRESWQAAFG